MSSARLEAAFARARAERRAALIPYLMAGDPSSEATVALVRSCIDGGADLVELGVPFSDPVADGPVIQRAGERALKNQTTLTSALKIAAAVRRASEVPIALMTYANPILALGEARFGRACAEAGVDGVLVPDLPPEESAGLRAACAPRGVAVPTFLSPVSDAARQRTAFGAASGFIYFVSVTGVTGARRALPAELPAKLREARAQSPVPIVVGFGVSEPAQARRLGRHADGVVVGSALVSRIAEGGSTAARVRRVRQFVQSLRNALEG